MSASIRVGWMKGCFHGPISGAVCPNTRCLEVEYLETYKLNLAFFTLHLMFFPPQGTFAIFSLLHDDTTIFPATQIQNYSYYWLSVFHPDILYCPIHSFLNSYQFSLHSDSFNSNHYLMSFSFIVHLSSACPPLALSAQWEQRSWPFSHYFIPSTYNDVWHILQGK